MWTPLEILSVQRNANQADRSSRNRWCKLWLTKYDFTFLLMTIWASFMTLNCRQATKPFQYACNFVASRCKAIILKSSRWNNCKVRKKWQNAYLIRSLFVFVRHLCNYPNKFNTVTVIDDCWADWNRLGLSK